MFSKEFMRYLIKYQSEEFPQKEEQAVCKKIKFPLKGRSVATILLACNK